jgi:hypothetical protein
MRRNKRGVSEHLSDGDCPFPIVEDRLLGIFFVNETPGSVADGLPVVLFQDHLPAGHPERASNLSITQEPGACGRELSGAVGDLEVDSWRYIQSLYRRAGRYHCFSARE